MEYFVLAAVRAGLDSPYDLKKNADLSVGATAPLLARLEKDGLLAGESAARRSRRFSLTAEGEKVLRREWNQLLQSVPSEFESILRIAYLAAAMGADTKTIHSFLSDCARQRRQLATVRSREAEVILEMTDPRGFGNGHRWLRAFCDVARLRTEADILSRIAARNDLLRLLAPSQR